MIYVENTIPQDLTSWKLDEVTRLRAKFRTDAYVLRGVLRWKSNQVPVPLDIFRDAHCTPPTAQADACDENTSRAIADYLAARSRMTDEDRVEEVMMARAAHGPGVTLVDVISGQHITT